MQQLGRKPCLINYWGADSKDYTQIGDDDDDDVDDDDDDDVDYDVPHLTASSSETLRLLFTRAVRARA